MLQVLIGVVSFVTATLAAPATPAGITSLVTPISPVQQYLLLPSHTQHQFQPTIKAQQPIIQSLTPLGRIQTPKEQLYVLYPNSPISQYPILLRQDSGNTDWWISVQNFFQNIGSNFSGSSESTSENVEKPPEESGSKVNPEKEAENFPAKLLAPTAPLASAVPFAQIAPIAPITPIAPNTPSASAQIISMDKRFYILSGQPQFFGNFDALHNPIGPVISLQPLQTIKARSAEETIQAEPETELKAIQEQELVAAAAAPAQPVENLDLSQLRNSLPELINPEKGVVNIDQDPSAIAVRQQLARYLIDEKLQIANNAENNQAEQVDQAPLDTLRKESESIKDPEFNLDEEASIAQAKPNAIALSGRGGLSSSSPVATAIVGDGGLALSSPSATAVSGDFQEDELEEDKKKSKN